MTDHIALLGLVVDRLNLVGYDASTPPPRAWMDATADQRAETLPHLAWQARDTEAGEPATDDASRLALWLWREATMWRMTLLPRAPFRVPPSYICRVKPEVQMDGAVRLLAAARTGELPPGPYRCAVCETTRDLWLMEFPGESGPGWDEWRCDLCRRLSIDPGDVPESVEVIYRRHLQRLADRFERP
ncbi:hypothetical protein [Streptomyces sp. 3N207]|uniref:hypothetical protein n=1 Tax=Streptomyces sp. 3N207 TaxID=3457417 RepID=UPI003FD47F8C